MNLHFTATTSLLHFKSVIFTPIIRRGEQELNVRGASAHISSPLNPRKRIIFASHIQNVCKVTTSIFFG